MFKHFFRSESEARLDSHVDDVLHKMREVGVDSDEYPKMMTYLERLNEVKVKDSRPLVNMDTVLLVLGNLAGILLIVAYEERHVMTSKAISQVIRPNRLS